MSARSVSGIPASQPSTGIVPSKREAISALVLSCLKSFQGLVARTKDPLTTSDIPDPSSIWADELGRLRVWAANIGAHQSGQSSLDYRLRDASHISQQIKKLLRDLRHTIRDIEDFLREEESPPSSPGAEPPVEGTESETELQQLHGDVKSIIDCLFQMSMLVRKPAHHDLWTDAGSTDLSIYEPFDLDHVRHKFPQADETLVQRLAHCMTRRRKILKYRERHHRKLSKGLDYGEAERHEDGISQTSPTIATTLKPDNDHSYMNYSARSEYTQTSFASSFLHGGEFSIPPPPKSSKDGAAFECPYCFFVISVRNEHAWYKHLFSDLLPYVCPTLSCSTPSKMYATQHEWLRHLRSAHPTEWQPAPQQTLTNEALHMDMVLKLPCPLCASDMAAGKTFERHLGRHLLGIACFVLPPAEPDVDGSDAASETNDKIEEEASTSNDQAADNDSDSSDGPPMLSRFLTESREDPSKDDDPEQLEFSTTSYGKLNPYESGSRSPYGSRAVSPPELAEPIPCPYDWCPRNQDPFTSAEELDNHLGTVHMKYVPTKGKEARTKAQISIASFSCPSLGCGYTTDRLGDLLRHQNGHVEEGTYPCVYEWCIRNTKPFTRIDHLSVHFRTVHLKDIPEAKDKTGQQSKQST